MGPKKLLRLFIPNTAADLTCFTEWMAQGISPQSLRLKEVGPKVRNKDSDSHARG